MSKEQAARYKAKKYYTRSTPKGRFTVEPKMSGFLCSCNSREKDCIRESYNLLNTYADQLYSPEPPSGAEPEADVDDLLVQEIATLKDSNRPNKRRFQAIESGAKNLLFIRTDLSNPVELATAIVKDIYDTKQQKTKFLLRMVPVEVTCRANLQDIRNAFAPLVEKYFRQGPQTYSVVFSHRNNDAVGRDEVIKMIAGQVSEARDDHKVDLGGAKVSIIVEIIRGFAFISVVPDYIKYKKYNLLTLSQEDQSEGCK